MTMTEEEAAISIFDSLKRNCVLALPKFENVNAACLV